MKKILYLLMLPFLLASCEGGTISGGRTNALDFLNLYGKSQAEILRKTKMYYVEETYADNGALSWIVKSNSETPYIRVGEYDYFVMLGFNGNKCNNVSLMNVETIDDDQAFNLISRKYGKSTAYDGGFIWHLRDKSFIFYYPDYDYLFIMRLTDSPNGISAKEISAKARKRVISLN